MAKKTTARKRKTKKKAIKTTKTKAKKRKTKKKVRKTINKKAAATKKTSGSGSTPVGPCDRGAEIKLTSLHIKQSDFVELFFQVCRGVGRIRVHLFDLATGGMRLIGTETNVDDKGRIIRAPVATLNPGKHMLMWTYDVVGGSQWKSTHEISLNDSTAFRLYKSATSGRPAPTLFMFLEVGA